MFEVVRDGNLARLYGCRGEFVWLLLSIGYRMRLLGLLFVIVGFGAIVNCPDEISLLDERIGDEIGTLRSL